MIYIASKTKHAPDWRKLRESGVPISSSWIDESGKGETKDWPDLWERCINEASEAHVLVVYCETGEQLKGALVEVGAALASSTPVIAVGIEHLNIKHHPLVTIAPTMVDAIANAMLHCPARQEFQTRLPFDEATK